MFYKCPTCGKEQRIANGGNVGLQCCTGRNTYPEQHLCQLIFNVRVHMACLGCDYEQVAEPGAYTVVKCPKCHSYLWRTTELPTTFEEYVEEIGAEGGFPETSFTTIEEQPDKPAQGDAEVGGDSEAEEQAGSPPGVQEEPPAEEKDDESPRRRRKTK